MALQLSSPPAYQYSSRSRCLCPPTSDRKVVDGICCLCGDRVVTTAGGLDPVRAFLEEADFRGTPNNLNTTICPANCVSGLTLLADIDGASCDVCGQDISRGMGCMSCNWVSCESCYVPPRASEEEGESGTPKDTTAAAPAPAGGQLQDGFHDKGEEKEEKRIQVEQQPAQPRDEGTAATSRAGGMPKSL